MLDLPPPDTNPCLSCGVCCTHFRVAFHWMELASGGGVVPDELTEPLDPHRVVMRGTRAHPVRCEALVGTLCEHVGCGIHPVRPSVCRDFPRSGEDGQRHERCERARAEHGLPPLMPLVPGQ